MRPGAVAVVAGVAALIGSAFAVVLGDRTGLADGGSTDTVFVSGNGAAQPIENRLPGTGREALLGNGFDPAAIYRSRSGRRRHGFLRVR